MVSIKFPSPSFRIRQQDACDEIFDAIRKRWMVLTPEEWVRQNFIAFLIETALVPASLISIEKEIAVGELRKRFDLVIYSKDGVPWMLVECKSMEVPLTEKTIEQLFSYFSKLQCEYAFITNGTYTYGWKILGSQCVSIDQFPLYKIAGLDQA